MKKNLPGFWLAGTLGLMLLACLPVSGADEPPPEAKAVGSLLIQCPFACQIVIPGIQPTAGSPQDRLQLSSVPVGTYTATFSGFNKQITYTFEITEGNLTHLIANIASGKVSDGVAARLEETPRPARVAAPAAVTAPKSVQAQVPAKAKPDPFAAPRFGLPGVGITMVAVVPGSFIMGSLTGNKNEKPMIKVTLSNRFWLSQTEVTQAQWRSLMDYNNSLYQGADQPITNVSWDNAMDFCRKLSEREYSANRLPDGYMYLLPTEAQWEYACRAGGTNDGDLTASAWCEATSGGQSHPVGQKQPNAWGFYDMHGNVSEWCLDWFDDYPGGVIADFSGPAEGSRHSFRGGAWAFPAVSCRSGWRSSEVPGNSHPNVGFRLALVKVR